MSSKKKITNQVYPVDIPEDWEVEYSNDGLVSIFDPNGRGAITLSSYSLSL
jgi:hypothetical protein